MSERRVHLARSFDRNQVEGAKLVWRAISILMNGPDLSARVSGMPGPALSMEIGLLLRSAIIPSNFVPFYTGENVAAVTTFIHGAKHITPYIYLNRGVRLSPLQWAAVISHELMHVALTGVAMIMTERSTEDARMIMSSIGGYIERGCAYACFAVAAVIECGVSPTEKCLAKVVSELEKIPETPPSGWVLDELAEIAPAYGFILCEEGFRPRDRLGTLR